MYKTIASILLTLAFVVIIAGMRIEPVEGDYLASGMAYSRLFLTSAPIGVFENKERGVRFYSFGKYKEGDTSSVNVLTFYGHVLSYPRKP